MTSLIKNRSEILFLYDTRDANPNGDPIDENKPRLDEETNINIVTDVRLKRTIRDYLYEHKKLDVFVREMREEGNTLKTKDSRLKDFDNDPKKVIDKCIDIRLFGMVTAVKDKTVTLTGPVQFKFGRSLHKVNIAYIKGTTIMRSKEEKKQGTFTDKYVLPYSLIAFYGVVNENAAQRQGIPLTEEDLTLMFESMWQGTKNLISGSKFGQMPRVLLQVIYKDPNFFIGEIDKYISLEKEKEDELIRDISDVKIDITGLVRVLNKHKDKIEKIKYKVCERVLFVSSNNDIKLEDALTGFSVEEFSF